jgi:hypothetical protein
MGILTTVESVMASASQWYLADLRLDDGLEQLCTYLGNAPGQKEIVQHKQIRVCVGAQNLGLFWLGGQPELRKVAVCFDVLDAVALQGCLVGHSLGDVTFTGAGFANDQGVGALGDEFERVQFEARLPGNLGVEAPIKVSQAGAFIEPGLFEPALCQTRTAPIEFVLQHGGKGVQERLLGALGLHDAGVHQLPGLHPRSSRNVKIERDATFRLQGAMRKVIDGLNLNVPLALQFPEGKKVQP